MLNPAGNPLDDDGPTTRAVRTFALEHQYGEILVGNIFTYMTPHPEDLSRLGFAVAAGGPHNTETQNALHIDLMAGQSYDEMLVAWGVLESGMVHMQTPFYDRLRSLGRNIVCLGKNKDGEPKHPGRLSRSTRFEPYERSKPASEDTISIRSAKSTASLDCPAAPNSQELSNDGNTSNEHDDPQGDKARPSLCRVQTRDTRR